jgi:hypothetical protein
MDHEIKWKDMNWTSLAEDGDYSRQAYEHGKESETDYFQTKTSSLEQNSNQVKVGI